MFLRIGTALPGGVAVPQEYFCKAWMSVSDLAAPELDIKVRAAGWHFMWLMEEHSALAYGRTDDSARSSVLSRALAKVATRFNAAESGAVRITKFPGFRIARVTVHARQLQERASLGV